jgi:hypothetical protein
MSRRYNKLPNKGTKDWVVRQRSNDPEFEFNDIERSSKALNIVLAHSERIAIHLAMVSDPAITMLIPINKIM